jgi:hypothetical protein
MVSLQRISSLDARNDHRAMGALSYELLAESTSSLVRDRVDQSQDVRHEPDEMHDHHAYCVLQIVKLDE